MNAISMEMKLDAAANRVAQPRIWINAPGKDRPVWVDEFMTNGQVASDGTFNIETGKGTARVLKGHAVVEVDGYAYACASAQIQATIAAARANPPKPGSARMAAPEPERPVPAAPQPPQAAEPAKVPAKVKLLATVGKPPVIEWIAPEELEVDDTYQRDIEGSASQSLITEIASAWDWRLCVSLICSRRNDGKVYVIDGQHRKEGGQLRNRLFREAGMFEGFIAHLPCTVHSGLTPEQEAELFVRANKARRPVQRLDQFHAALAAGDPKTVELNKLITEAGLRVGRSQAWQMIKAGEVVFVSAVQRAAKLHGRETALKALKLIGEAFAGQPFPTAGAMFNAIISFTAEREKAGAPVDFSLLGNVLAGSTFQEWKEMVVGATNGFDRDAQMEANIAAAYDEAAGAE